MRHEIFRDRIALRIDIDFEIGLRRAVPLFLEALRHARMSATFFVVAGRNRPRSSLRRLTRAAYWRRLGRLGPARIVRTFGASLCTSGDMLSSADAQRNLQRIVDEGHELAVHGYDHAWWSDRVWSASPQALAGEIERAYATLTAAVEPPPLAWGSPHWRTSDTVIELLQQRGVPYLAESWGEQPFLTRTASGQVVPIVHLPITVPSLESPALSSGSLHDRTAAALGDRPSDRYDQACVHDYYEGGVAPGLFAALLHACERRGLTTEPLGTMAARVERAGLPLPCCSLARRPADGFPGDVSWQQADAAAPAGAT